MTYYILTSERDGDPSEEFVDTDRGDPRGSATRAYYEEKDAIHAANLLNEARTRKGKTPDIVVMQYTQFTVIHPMELA